MTAADQLAAACLAYERALAAVAQAEGALDAAAAALEAAVAEAERASAEKDAWAVAALRAAEEQARVHMEMERLRSRGVVPMRGAG